MRYKLFIFLVFLCSLASSQTCCSGGVPISSNIGMSILEKGTIQFGLNYDLNSLKTLKEGGKKLDDSSRERITSSVLLNLGYNITDDWTIEGLLTWVRQRREIFTLFGSSLSQTNGVGDAIILTRYRYLNSVEFSASAGFGLKLPTGSHDIKSPQGILFNADLQPGSNSLDYVFITSLSKKFKFRRTFLLSSRVVYRLAGKNKEYQNVNTYKFGDELQVFLGISDQFLVFNEMISSSISFKYRNSGEDLINENKVPSTGGDWLFLVPNLIYRINKSVDFVVGGEIPLYSNVVGTQLTPTYRFNIGVVFKLYKKIKL